MYNNDTELLFPPRVMQALVDQRGTEWAALINRVRVMPEDSLDHLAFVLMMTKLNGCLSCNADSFRAMRGCTQCAVINVRRNKSKDQELIKQYEKARSEIERTLNKIPHWRK